MERRNKVNKETNTELLTYRLTEGLMQKLATEAKLHDKTVRAILLQALSDERYA